MRLLPDCGGPIGQIALTLPGFVFAPAQEMKRRAIASLAEALPAGIKLLVLTEAISEGAADLWAARLKLSCQLQILPVAAAMQDADIWTQDTFMAAERDGGPVLLPLPHTDHAGQHAQWLRQAGYDLGPAPAIHLAGGNTLVGPDFRLAGAKSVENTTLIGDGPISPAEALSRHVALDPRAMHVFGFAPPTRTGPASLAQQPHHLDLVVSMTGTVTADGKPILLVADPRKTRDPDGPRMEGWAEQLDASAQRLAADGFAVMRNKVPYLAHPTYAPNPMLRAYNNVILENDIRVDLGKERPLVWMPQFGDLEPDLTPYDNCNRLLWQEHGFEVAPVHGWSALVRAGGAIRCASKVLTRRQSSHAKVAPRPFLK